MLNPQQKLDALAQLGIDLNQVQDLDILMERILTEARRFVSADAGSIYIRDDRHLRFTYTQNETLQSRLGKGEKLIFSTFAIPISDKSIAGFVAASRQLLNLSDVYKLDPGCPYHFDKTFDRKTQYVTRSVLTVPLVASNKDLVGILQIINAMDAGGQVIRFSSEDEYEEMKLHTVRGARLFADRRSDFDEAAAQIALNHHERWDGKGYPGHVDIATGNPLPGATAPNIR